MLIGIYVEAAANTKVSSNNKEKITVQLKWYHQFQFAGYYAAIEKGFYAEEGLQVELRQRVAGTSHIEDVLEGRAQYGVSDAGLLLARQQGKPVVLLAQILQHSPLVLLTRKDSGIRSAEDLAGKRVMFDAEGDGNMPIIPCGFNVIKVITSTSQSKKLSLAMLVC